uniref:Neuralized E3 ubiquitin protein ligase 2 n=1 Tax=Petromyzon marinus TaxID=7757 RepID=S4RRI1_PETMA
AYEKFHVVHGGNMHMDSTRTHATRVRSFGDAVCMSAQPLPPGRVFLVELSQKETGWCGHLRVGLTRLCPGGSDGLSRQRQPKIVVFGKSWVKYELKNHLTKAIGTACSMPCCGHALRGAHVTTFTVDVWLYVGNHVIVRDSLVGRSRVGRYSHLLDPLFKTHILSTTARGTRIGVIWRILEEEGVMHLLVNGRDLGVFARGIPTHTPIFAVVDVFGCTRAVTVLHVEYAVPSLQTICRRMIQKLTVNRLAISRLGLPAALQCYCQYK